MCKQVLGGFCTLDLSAGYWQIAMEDGDKEKTAFTIVRGHYQFSVMPFGLCNSPATLERLMELVLGGLYLSTCLCYMDDIVVQGRALHGTRWWVLLPPASVMPEPAPVPFLGFFLNSIPLPSHPVRLHPAPVPSRQYFGTGLPLPSHEKCQSRSSPVPMC